MRRGEMPWRNLNKLQHVNQRLKAQKKDPNNPLSRLLLLLLMTNSMMKKAAISRLKKYHLKPRHGSVRILAPEVIPFSKSDGNPLIYKSILHAGSGRYQVFHMVQMYWQL